MKKYSILLLMAWSFLSCGGGGGDDPPTPPPVANRAPSTPTQSAPTNNLLCIDNVVQFQWTAASDPDGDAISYQLQIATNTSFSENLKTNIVTGTSTSVSLEKGIAYYWRVKAVDSKNASSSYSSTFNFYTEGEGISNHLPFIPTLVKPDLNTVVTTASVTLEWTASDVDNDPLTFDVYLGTNNPPTTKIGDNQSATSLTTTLNASTDYYWKVVVKDGNGGQTIGQVWNFKTD